MQEDKDHVQLLSEDEPIIAYERPTKKKGRKMLCLAAAIAIPLILAAIIAASVCFADVSCLHHLRVKRPLVILVSLDGYRWEYLQNETLPHPVLSKLAKEGFSAPLRSIFPTLTFPNHYTIVTGLYAESHGIVSNTFYDPVFDATFKYSAPIAAEPRWWGGHPLWNVVQDFGIKSGCFFWPGADVEINGRYPNYWVKFDDSIPMKQRVDTIIEWLSEGVKARPHFVTLYFSNVDTAGHQHGPDSPKMAESIAFVDNALKYLLDELENANINTRDDVQVLVVSDHGMTETPASKVIYLDEVLAPFLPRINISDYGPVPQIWANEETVKAGVMAALEQTPHITPFLKPDIPFRYHWQHNRRIPPITALADEGYSVLKDRQSWLGKGNHGYDPDLPDMQAIFVGYGSRFSAGSSLPHVNNTEIFNIACDILGIKPPSNNGTSPVFPGVLVTPSAA